MNKDKYKISIITYDFKSCCSAIANRMRAFVGVLTPDFDCFLLTSRRQGVGMPAFEIFFSPQNNKLPFLARLLLDILYGICLFFYLLFDKKDLYLVSSPPFFSNFLAILALRLKKQKYILDVRDLYPKVFITNGLIKSGGILARFATLLEKMMYDGASYITTTTNPMKAHISSITSTPVAVVMNGYDDDVSYERKEGQAIKKIVFLGTLASYSDVLLMLEVFSSIHRVLPYMEFAIIGDGKFEVKNIDFPCEIIKFLPHHQIKDHTKDASIGVCFLKDNELTKEILPVKIFEYLGLELIPVINVEGEASKLLRKYDVGVVIPSGEASKLADSLLKFIADKNRQQEILKNIKEKKHLFTREFEAKKILSIIKTLLKS